MYYPLMKHLLWFGWLALAGCASDGETKPSTPVEGHLEGAVTLRTGTCLPPTPCSVMPLAGTTVWLYAPIHGHTAYPDVSSLLPLAETTASSQGHYRLDAPPGQYTVLVDDAGSPRSMFEAYDVLTPVAIHKDQNTTLDLEINHAVD
jgi:hypothetical protein